MRIPLTYTEAVRSPCLECTASPCCTHLLLNRFQLETLGDVDYITYLANFEGILIGIDQGGTAQAYLSQPCGNLDVGTGLCQVHGTPEQPSICVHYNAHSCRYRHGMTADLNPEHPLMDSTRARWYVEHVTFTDDRRVHVLPDWGELLEAFQSMPLERRQAPPPGPDRAFGEWKEITLGQKPPPNGTYDEHRFVDASVTDPCGGCEAWCCQAIVIGRDLPEDASQVDFFRYCLGFPGVELGVSEDSWALIVKTRCSNLEGNRCSVYGHPERPLRCEYYDQLKCVYRGHFGKPKPEDLVRVAANTFPVLLHSVVFDGDGKVRRLPSTELLQDRIEKAMVAGAV